MTTFIDFFQFILRTIETTLGNYHLLLLVVISLFLLKITLFITLLSKGNRTSNTFLPWFLLMLVLSGTLFESVAWTMKMLQLTQIIMLDTKIRWFTLSLAWMFTLIEYQALALFFDSLIEPRFKFRLHHICFIAISSILLCGMIGTSIISIFNMKHHGYDRTFYSIIPCYLVLVLMPFCIGTTLKNIKQHKLPRILKKQLNVLLKMLIVPWWFCELLQVWPFNFTPGYVASSYAAISISNILLTYVIYYSARRMVGLRFLNLKNHVEAPVKYNFIDHFKDVLEQLSQATNSNELIHITQTYLKDIFHIPLRQSMLYIRKTSPTISHEAANFTLHKHEKMQADVESFLNSCSDHILAAIKEAKILIYDEIAFNNFYTADSTQEQLLSFLETINADIFLPIYEKQQLIAYVIIERNARSDQFYSNMEHDELIVFASYLSNIIHLLQNRNLEELIYQEKELKEELYSKHQEINQYKESIRSFLHTDTQKRIGIIFYKSRKFIFGNQAAKELIAINPNAKTGQSISKALHRLVIQVIDYKAPQTHFTKDINGNQLVLNGVLNIEKNNVIITVYRPEISDIMTKQVDQLKDPSKWDYLLYLETTRSGRLINQLIPGSGETLLSFKTALLKAALSKKAVLLDMPEKDQLPTAELLHHISLRDNLHTLALHGPEKQFETAIKLFGMNPLLIDQSKTETPLLKKLHPNGTLFIQNIQYLQKETQEQLAEFIRYGFYRLFKSNQKHVASVRIICSSSQNLTTLVHKEKFSPALYDELKKTTLIMPSLITLPEHELSNLADGFSEQAIQEKTFKSLIELSSRDKSKLTNHRPVSLQELKTRVQHLLVTKSKRNDIYHETQFDPAYEISDPDLIQAARLGKHALKDPKTMALLWDKFKNQNKIATFLGVNRSSVNRRCRKYKLI